MTENPTTTTACLTDDEGGTLRVYPWASGRMFLVAHDGDHCVEFGPVERHVLLDAIRAVAGETDDKPEPAPAPSKSPTAEDFAKAQFARHKDGLIAARLDGGSLPWYGQGHMTDIWHSDADMAAEGWSIVTPAPSTPREALALVVSLAYEPEGDTMPDQRGYMTVWESGEINVYSDTNPRGTSARGTTYRCLLLDPPGPVTPTRPEGAERGGACARRRPVPVGQHERRHVGVPGWEQLRCPSRLPPRRDGHHPRGGGGVSTSDTFTDAAVTHLAEVDYDKSRDWFDGFVDCISWARDYLDAKEPTTGEVKA